MPWGVAAAAVGAAGGIYSANQAADAQSDAARQAAKQAKKGGALYDPFYQSGVGANRQLNMLMGMGGNETRESLYAKLLPQYINYREKSSDSSLLDSAKSLKQGMYSKDPNATKEGLAGLEPYTGHAAIGRSKLGSKTKGWNYGGILKGKGSEDLLNSNADLKNALAQVGGRAGYSTVLKAADYAKLEEQINKTLAEQEAMKADPQYGYLTKQFTGDDLQNEAGYQFRLGEGANLLNRSLATRGGLFSGAAGKEMTQYGQNFASNEFQNAFSRDTTNKNRLYDMYGGTRQLGMNAAAGQAGAYQNIGEYGIQGANAQAAGSMAQGNALNDALSGGLNYWQQQSQMPSGFKAGEYQSAQNWTPRRNTSRGYV